MTDDFDARLARLDERMAATTETLKRLHQQVEALRSPIDDVGDTDDRYTHYKPTRTPMGGVWMMRVMYTDSGGMEHAMTDWALTTDALRRAFEDAVEVTESMIESWKAMDQ